jgi:CoA-dependent NAD(P)H sulfur oxidoreductase
MPYYVSGQIQQNEDLIALLPEDAIHKRNIDVRTRHEAITIDRAQKTVTVLDHAADRQFEQTYEKLIIATGAKPIIPPLEGIRLEGVFPLKEFQDGINLKGFIEQYQPRCGVIIGGGYIGVEMAEAFRRVGMEVWVVEAQSRIMAIMDADMASLVTEELQSHGVEIITGRKVIGLDGQDRVRSVRLDDDRQLDADCVLLSIGVMPQYELAEKAGLRLGPAKAILVDHYLRTSDPDIYAAGDCSAVYHRILREPLFIPLGLTANRQGRMCGENIVAELSGQRPRPFPGIIGTAVTKVFNLEMAKTGIGSSEIERYGLGHIRAAKIKGRNLPHFFPGSTDVWVKLFYEDHTGVIVGGQIVGGTGAALRIDVIAAAVTQAMRLDELYDLDMAYAPPISPVWDPLLLAARTAMNDLD